MEIVQAMLMKICRLCTKEQPEEKRMYHIFKQNETNIDAMLYRVTWVTNLEMCSGDGLPPQICEECYSALYQSYIFKQRCYASDRELRQFIQNLKGELGDLTTTTATIDEEHQRNNEDHSHATTAVVTLSDDEQELKAELKEPRSLNAGTCDTTQIDEKENVAILTHKVDDVSDNEMSILEPIVSISFPTNKCIILAEPTTVNPTDNGNMNEGCEKVDTSQSTGTLLQNDFPQQVCSFVLPNKHTIAETKVESNQDLQSTQPELKEAPSTTKLIDEANTTNQKPNWTVLDNGLSITQGELPIQSLNLNNPCKEIKLYCFPCKASFTDSNELNMHLTSHSEPPINLLGCADQLETPRITLEIVSEEAIISTPEQSEHNEMPLSKLSDPKVMPISSSSDPKMVAVSKHSNTKMEHVIKQSDPKLIPISSTSDPKMVAVSKHSVTKMEQVIKQSDPKLIPLSKQSDPKFIPLSKHSDTKMEPVSKQSDTKMVAISKQSDTKVIPIRKKSDPTDIPTSQHSDPKLIPIRKHSDPKDIPTSQHSDPKVMPANKHSDLITQLNIDFQTKAATLNQESDLTQVNLNSNQEIISFNSKKKEEKDIRIPIVKLVNTMVCKDVSTPDKTAHAQDIVSTPIAIHAKTNEPDCETSMERAGVLKLTSTGTTKDISSTRSDIDLIDKTSLKNERTNQVVSGSKCDLIKNSFVSLKVVLERCDTNKIINNKVKTKNTDEVKKKEDACSGKGKESIIKKPSTKDIHSKYRKDESRDNDASGNKADRKSSQHKTLKERIDSGASTSKHEFDDLRKPSKRGNDSGDLHKSKAKTSKGANQTTTKETSLIDGERVLATAATSDNQTLSKVTRPSNDNPKNILNSEASLEYQGCLKKDDFRKTVGYTVHVNKKYKLGEQARSNSNKKYSPASTHRSLTDNRAEDNTESKTLNIDKISQSANLSLTRIKEAKSREIPPETLDFNTLTKMLKSHFETKTFPCTLCDKVFSRGPLLKVHLRGHTGEMPFSCHDCGRKYPEKRLLKRHIRVLHIAEKPFNCKTCPKSYLTRRELETHVRIHTGYRPYKCSLCPKTYTVSRNLHTHQLSHLGERNFQCHLCTKSFWLNSILKSHLLTHNPEKNFTCPVCEKAFASAKSLRIHERTHTHKRVFKCKLCPAAYVHPATLKDHMRKHNGDTFNCMICAKSFVKKTKLREHLSAHSGKRRFECVPCGKTFLHKNSLMKHERKKHNDGKPSEGQIATGPDLNELS